VGTDVLDNARVIGQGMSSCQGVSLSVVSCPCPCVLCQVVCRLHELVLISWAQIHSFWILKGTLGVSPISGLKLNKSLYDI
jgi:hypothetical protein